MKKYFCYFTALKKHFVSNSKEASKIKLVSCNFKITFTLPVKVNNFFTFKDKLTKMLLSGLVYKYKSGGCNATYYGKTTHYFKVRICEHLGILHLTVKKVNIDKTI